MTKMKSKKMTKSTFAIIIMGIVMVAMLAFGGTFAYFTAKSNAVEAQKITMAHVTLKANSATASLTMSQQNAALPGDAVKLTAEVENASNRKVYIFVQIKTANDSTMGLDLTGESGEWKAATVEGFSNVYYITSEAAAKVTWEKEATLTETGNSTSDNGVVAGNMDKIITITVKFAATQYAKTSTTAGVETPFEVAEAFDLVKAEFTAD